jgi:hypothetical protein
MAIPADTWLRAVLRGLRYAVDRKYIARLFRELDLQLVSGADCGVLDAFRRGLKT